MYSVTSRTGGGVECIYLELILIVLSMQLNMLHVLKITVKFVVFPLDLSMFGIQIPEEFSISFLGMMDQ